MNTKTCVAAAHLSGAGFRTKQIYNGNLNKLHSIAQREPKRIYIY